MSALDVDEVRHRLQLAQRRLDEITQSGASVELVDECLDDVPRLLAEVSRLTTERAALAERIQLMADAERESGRQAVHRAVGLEMAAQVVAGMKEI